MPLSRGRPLLETRHFLDFLKAITCDIRFYSAYQIAAFEVIKINFSMKRSTLEEIKLILTKMCHELPNNLHDSAILTKSNSIARVSDENTYKASIEHL